MPDSDMEGRLDLLDLLPDPLLRRRSFLDDSVSSMLRRNSTLDAMFVSSSELTSPTTVSLVYEEFLFSDIEGLPLDSCSRR